MLRPDRLLRRDAHPPGAAGLGRPHHRQITPFDGPGRATGSAESLPELLQDGTEVISPWGVRIDLASLYPWLEADLRLSLRARRLAPPGCTGRPCRHGPAHPRRPVLPAVRPHRHPPASAAGRAAARAAAGAGRRRARPDPRDRPAAADPAGARPPRPRRRPAPAVVRWLTA